VLFLGERLRLPQIAATVAIMAGSTVLIWRGGARAGTLCGTAFVSWTAWLAAAVRALAQVVAKAGLLLWPNAYAAVTLSYTVSAAAIWIIAAVSRRPESRIYTARGAAWFALTGLCNGAAVMALYTALEDGAVNLVSPIAATYPLFTLLFNAILLREERASVRMLSGVALMVGGVAALLVL
jgi:uncharacterized membrane protein